MKCSGVFAVLIACTAPAPVPVAAPKPAAAAPSEWSPIVAGLRGRLIATPTTDGSGRAQVKLEIELARYTDLGNPIAIWWGFKGEMVQLVVEDEAGHVLPMMSMPTDEEIAGTYAQQIPNDSTLRFTVSDAALAYDDGQWSKLFLPLQGEAWDLANRHGALFVRGTFRAQPNTAIDKSSAADDLTWIGPLELPRIALPYAEPTR